MKRIALLAFTVGVFFFSLGGSFAATTATGTNTTTKENSQTGVRTPEEKEKPKTKEKETPESETEVRKEINSYIIEAYKIQGNKILKDIDIGLQKLNLNNASMKEAYSRIQDTLESRKKRISSSDDISDNSKEILDEYLSYMISALAKRIKNLE